MTLHNKESNFKTYPIYIVSKFTALLALGGHFLFLIIFILLEINALVYVNICSCLIFLSAVILNKYRRHKTILAITITEIITHSYIATSILGWSSGFHIYIMCLIPLIFFYRFFKVFWKNLLIVIIFGLYVLLKYISGFKGYDYSIPIEIIDLLELMNFLIAFIVFAILSASYSVAAMYLENQLREKNIELDASSRVDHLTGLSNRRDILDKIKIERAKMIRNDIKCCFVLSDIDYFKRINDSYGHDFGDFVLREISRLIQESLRSQDYICRWGGEEFLLVLPDTDISGSIVVAEKIRKVVSEYQFSCNSVNISVTMTFGISEYNHKNDVDESIKIADRLLYTGKENGRNCVVT